MLTEEEKKDRKKAYAARWYKKNKERLAAYYDENRDRLIDYQKKWAKKNTETANKNAKAYQARKKEAEGFTLRRRAGSTLSIARVFVR